MITISGNGMADPDGDLIWIEIDVEDASFKLVCPAEDADLLRTAFLAAICTAELAIVNDRLATSTLKPISIGDQK